MSAGTKAKYQVMTDALRRPRCRKTACCLLAFVFSQVVLQFLFLMCQS